MGLAWQPPSVNLPEEEEGEILRAKKWGEERERE